MYPNQQQPQPPQTPPQSPGGYPPQPPQSQPQNPYAQPSVNLPPQQPGYGPQPAATYAVDYLEQIAPPPPQGKFLSGSFGKIIIGLGIVLVLAVSIIAASGGAKRTADLENVAVRLDNMQTVTKSTQKNLKSGKLLATNSNYQIWIANANRDAYDLLAQAEVKKSDMNKKMIASEKDNGKKLTATFDDARLNANLDRVYAREMAYQTQMLITEYNKINKTSEAKAIREYAKKASTDLTPIQKSFSEYDDSIN